MKKLNIKFLMVLSVFVLFLTSCDGKQEKIEEKAFTLKNTSWIALASENYTKDGYAILDFGENKLTIRALPVTKGYESSCFNEEFYFKSEIPFTYDEKTSILKFGKQTLLLNQCNKTGMPMVVPETDQYFVLFINDKSEYQNFQVKIPKNTKNFKVEDANTRITSVKTFKQIK